MSFTVMSNLPDSPNAPASPEASNVEAAEPVTTPQPAEPPAAVAPQAAKPSESTPVVGAADAQEYTESFGDLLRAYDQSHSAGRTESGQKQIQATVVSLTADAVLLDIGYKTEGILPLTAFAAPPAPGDTIMVTPRGSRDEDGYYQLSLLKFAQLKDLTSLQEAYDAKTVIAGTVTAANKGGFTIDISGIRAFLPASRSGARDQSDAEKLVGQEVRVRITKLEIENEDVTDMVVDRRSVLEDEEKATRTARLAEIQEGQIVHGTIRSLTPYGAFVDIGGTDGLLHISDIAWTRVTKPDDILSVGDSLDLKVLKSDSATGKISLGLKQLLPHPWDAVPEKYHVGDRVRGTVTRDTDFGSFIEIEPGVEGLVHISEMSWNKKVRKPSDLLKVGDTVETVILAIDPGARRMGLGLKQALGDPWANVSERFPIGSAVDVTVASFTKFGAFLQLSEGVEGLVHISEIVADRRLNHPSDALRVGEQVKALVLDVDKEKRQLRLSIKQLIPTGLDDFLIDHKAGDTVTGRIINLHGNRATVELGEGIVAPATLPAPKPEESSAAPANTGAVDLSALGSLLKAKWQGNAPSTAAKPKSEGPAPGQIRSFRITTLNPESKQIELELA
jgi:small subunit ribosomal protein S1